MRVAAIQSSPVLDDAERVLDAIVERLEWADRERVDLVLFPEAFLLGHSYDAGVIRRRADAAAAAIDRLCERVGRFGSTLVLGAFATDGDAVTNRALVIERGRVVGHYDKAYPNEPGVAAGVDSPAFVRSGWRYGINICADANYPDAAARLAEAGATLLLYPLNNLLPAQTAARWRERSLANLVDRARQTQCWVVSSDVVGMLDGWVSHGCTAIVSPVGDVVARVAEDMAGVVTYDLPARADD